MIFKSRDILIYFSLKYDGDYEKILNAIKARERINDQAYEAQVSEGEEFNAITIVDSDYPHAFKCIPNPPLVVFYKGDVTLLNNLDKAIAVIGAREYSDYGKEHTIKIVTDLVKEGFMIVSGMARGIDGFAHEAALSASGKTIAVLGSGIEYPYPLSHTALYNEIAEKGLIISEYPRKVKPEPEFFKFRNRLVAALSHGLFIVEAKYRSGTIITASYALERGSDIFCLPERAGMESGTNKLIKDGAYLVESAADIINLWTN